MAKRIIILVLVVLGIFFVYKSSNTDKTDPEKSDVEKTEEVKEEEKSETLLDKLKDTAKDFNGKDKEEPSSSAETSKDKKEEVTETPKSTYTPPKTTITKPVVTKTPVSGRKTTVRAYVYEWGIDLSNASIPNGTVTFEVMNTGKFSHDFRIKEIANFGGKVRPGEVQEFTVNLRNGDYVAYSERGKDGERGLRENFQVVTPMP